MQVRVANITKTILPNIALANILSSTLSGIPLSSQMINLYSKHLNYACMHVWSLITQ